MKIDRVILSCDANPTYYEFWNPLSKLYKINFGIEPTLIFVGSEQELEKSNLSTEYGPIFRQDKVPSQNFAWTTTWALFYFTKLFPNDICLINGIDQIPLGTRFLIDAISEISDDNYVMLIDDAYKLVDRIKDWSEGGYSPTGYHIAKGSLFTELYKFEESFEDEIKKIESLNIKSMWGTWGLDEAYSSQVLYHNQNKIKIMALSKTSELINGRRIDCFRTQETPYSVEMLKNNEYIECHSCRPFSNHQSYLTDMINNVPKFV